MLRSSNGAAPVWEWGSSICNMSCNSPVPCEWPPGPGCWGTPWLVVEGDPSVGPPWPCHCHIPATTIIIAYIVYIVVFRFRIHFWQTLSSSWWMIRIGLTWCIDIYTRGGSCRSPTQLRDRACIFKLRWPSSYKIEINVHFTCVYVGPLGDRFGLNWLYCCWYPSDPD